LAFATLRLLYRFAMHLHLLPYDMSVAMIGHLENMRDDQQA
jgi:hypothetical protein